MASAGVVATTLALTWWVLDTDEGSGRVDHGVGGQLGAVDRVVDGDTLDVAGVGRVRLIGVDAPERGECGFFQAADHLSRLTLDEQVRLVPSADQPDSDRYGRLLRYVLVDGVDAGLSLIEQGLATARYDSRDGYGRHDRQGAYVRADQPTPAGAGCGKP